MTVSHPVRPRRWHGGRIASFAAISLVPLVVAGTVIGALADADTALDRVPAAIVNADQLVQQTEADGSTTPVFAGRQLVTELTKPVTGDAPSNFDWQITNADDAADMLAAGEVYAVLTVPKGFSASILSLQSQTPTRASLSIRTDDAHSYLSSTAADAIGVGLVSAFGEQITTRYLTGVYENLGTLGSSLTTAADGAGELETGASGLQTGLEALADGASTASSGAETLSSGVAQYTEGVTSLGSGLRRLQTGAAGLNAVSSGVSGFTSGVAQLSAGIAGASAQLNDADPDNDVGARATLAALSDQLATVASGGPTLASGTASGISGVQSGLAQSVTGAARLNASAPALTSGAGSLASGLTGLATGASDAESGAGELAAGAGALSSGLRDGAANIPTLAGGDAKRLADVVASPIELTVSRDNAVPDFGQQLATALIPLALWLGALAAFVVARPLATAVLRSTARTSRLLGSRAARVGVIALAQTVPLVVLTHTALGVPWSAIPVSFAVILVCSLVFTAIHQALFLLVPRIAVVVSVLLIAVQQTAAGGIYPVELLATPFAAASPLLPFTYAVSGMQALFSGSELGSVASALVALVAFGLTAIALSAIAITRSRTIGFRRLATR